MEGMVLIGGGKRFFENLSNFVQAFFIFLFLSFPSFGSDVLGDSKTPLPIQSARNSVWRINGLLTYGTGFFTGQRLFVTNFHTLTPMLLRHDIKDITLSQEGNPVVLKIKTVLALSSFYDLALVEIENPVSHYLTLGDGPPKSKEDLFVLGYPNGVFTEVKKTGNVFFNGYNSYSFAINHTGFSGGSGGPVLSKKGEGIGMVFRGAQESNISITLTSSHLKKIIKGEIGLNCISFVNIRECIEEEVKSIKALAEQGSAVAQLNLAYMYAKSELFERAFKWVKKAAKQGHPEAQYNLGGSYKNGLGIARDVQKALEWWVKAAEQGEVSAQYSLGLVYIESAMMGGITQDFQKAVQWLMKAAKQGHSKAQYDLGDVYFNGVEGVEKDLQKTVEWWRKAAQQNYAPAQYSMGAIHYHGIGVTRDFQKAVEWWVKAAEQGYPDAQLNLSYIYNQGEGIERNPDMANYWYSKYQENPQR